MGRRIEITTLRTSAGECADGRTCPSVHLLADRPGRRYVVTKRLDDPDEIAAFAPLVAVDEQVGWVPADLLRER